MTEGLQNVTFGSDDFNVDALYTGILSTGNTGIVHLDNLRKIWYNINMNGGFNDAKSNYCRGSQF